MIKEYKFGSITIDGKTYGHDVETRWSGEVLKWWRGESHVIDVGDVKRAAGQNPETIIIGTGESGIAKVTEEAQKFIKEKGIKLIIDKTEEAVKTFNVIVEEEIPSSPLSLPLRGSSVNEESELEEGKRNKVIGLFHLTC